MYPGTYNIRQKQGSPGCRRSRPRRGRGGDVRRTVTLAVVLVALVLCVGLPVESQAQEFIQYHPPNSIASGDFTVTDQLFLKVGTATSPSLCFTGGSPTTGDPCLYSTGAGGYSISLSGYGNTTERLRIAFQGISLFSDTAYLRAGVSADVFLGRSSAGYWSLGLSAASPGPSGFIGVGPRAGTDTDTAGGALRLGGGRGTGTGVGGSVVLATAPAGSTGTSQNALVDRFEVETDGDVRIMDAYGGGVRWVTQVEEITLDTGGTTTDSVANLLPADAVIEAVSVRVTTTITTAVNFQVGDTSTAARFCAAQTTLTAGTTYACSDFADQTGAGGPIQAAADQIRITTNANPGAGKIRVTVTARVFVAPET